MPDHSARLPIAADDLQFEVVITHGSYEREPGALFVGRHPRGADLTPEELFSQLCDVGEGRKDPFDTGEDYLVGRVEGDVYSIDLFEVLSVQCTEQVVLFSVKHVGPDWEGDSDGDPAVAIAYFKLPTDVEW